MTSQDTHLVPVGDHSPTVPRQHRMSSHASSQLATVPDSLPQLQSQLDLWQPFTNNGQQDATWREFLREQQKVEQDMLQMEQELGMQSLKLVAPEGASRSGWADAKHTSNGELGIHHGGKTSQELAVADRGSPGREVIKWPAPVIKQHHNGLKSFALDVDVGDTYRPDDIHVNIVDGHVLHIHAQHRYMRRKVKDNTVSASRQLCQFDRRFALPDHKVRPENLSCLVSPEGILHIRGFLGEDIVKQRGPAGPDTSSKGSKAGRRKVNFAVFGSKKSN